MEVTPAARGVLVQAESMLSNATSIERHLAGLDREMAGVVRVAATEGLAAQWLGPRPTGGRGGHSGNRLPGSVGAPAPHSPPPPPRPPPLFCRPTSRPFLPSA